jgi:hypothetical protein
MLTACISINSLGAHAMGLVSGSSKLLGLILTDHHTEQRGL